MALNPNSSSPADYKFENKNVLTYPNVHMDEYPYWVTFQTVRDENKTIEEAATNFLGDLLTKQIRGTTATDEPKKSDSKIVGKSVRVKGKKIVKLYLPPAFQTALRLSYDTPSLGASGALMEQGLSAGENLIESGATALGEAGGSLISAFTSSLTTDAAKVAGNRLAQNFGEGVQGAVRSASKVAVNPNTRSLFKSVNLREFSFTFKMIPKSADEAAEIKAIVKYFRSEAMPESIKLNGALENISIGYKFPNKFMIKVLKGLNKDITHRFLDCYLAGVNVTYNAGSMGMHYDGNFSETDMTLTFIEERALTKEDILNPDGGY